LKLIDFLTSPRIIKQDATDYSLAPPLKTSYDDPAVKRALPFSNELRQAVQQARARPVSPEYPLISQAIYKNVYEALTGRVTPEKALEQANAGIKDALGTF
jgi:multiple sugar transport system substrate-binding protein